MRSLRYFVLAGPTAVGKTGLAIKIATELQTEIVSCDAYQIYSGLDLLTAKPSRCYLDAVRHHLIGILPLTDRCDACLYAQLSRKIISDLNARGIIPLVVAGTGFYLQALGGALPDLPAADLELRRNLDLLPTSRLLQDLEIRDPIASGRIDRNNRRRIIRALEVCILSGKPYSASLTGRPTDPPISGVTFIRGRSELNERIDRRVEEMFDRGVVEEVAAVESVGSTASKAIGFQLIQALLAGTMDTNACKDQIKHQTHNYAKRQMTWFRKMTYEIITPNTSLSNVIQTLLRPRKEALEAGGRHT